jgi:hypothetical protein
MIGIMRQRLISLAAAVMLWAMTPLYALAASQVDESKIVDGRLEGYPRGLTLDGGSALIWLLLIGLAVPALGVLFKHAKRTHLD